MVGQALGTARKINYVGRHFRHLLVSVSVTDTEMSVSITDTEMGKIFFKMNPFLSSFLVSMCSLPPGELFTDFYV